MPKKTQRNAFYFFMKELEPQLRREGRVFPNGMADVVPIAHPRWKDLPAKEKERFENMAKDFKAKMRGTEGDKFRMDTKGNIIAYRKDENQELMNYFMKMGKEVKAKWPPGLEIMDESFFLINIQTLCETDDGNFLPCEIACLEFSLSKGIIKTFHRFIDPGRIPIGFKYTCRQNSELTHQIPYENFDKADADYSWMWTQLKNFVNPNREKDVYPPVYCRPSVYRETKKSLEWLHIMAMDRGTCKLGRVLNLELLLMDLYNHIGKTVTHAAIINILGTTSYDFIPNHLCEYHENLECKYCSLGIIRRYAFCMFDELSEVYPFELTAQHLPERPDKDLGVTVIPPPKESIFPAPTVNRGQMTYSELARKGGKQDRGDGVFASRDYRYARQSETSDSDEERQERKDATSLRLPKTPAKSLSSAQSMQGSRPSGSVGRGLAVRPENPGVAASLVRAPGSVLQPAWPRRPAEVCPRPGLGAGVPVGRGMRPPGSSAGPMPPSGPGFALPTARPGVTNAGCGRGVLGPLAHQVTQFRVPVGRGFAPPSMTAAVSDGMASLSLSCN